MLSRSGLFSTIFIPISYVFRYGNRYLSFARPAYMESPKTIEKSRHQRIIKPNPCFMKKKGRIILTLCFLLAIAGAGLAFKALRFTTDQVFTPTTIVFYEEDGVVYYTTGNLCTSVNRWISTTGPITTVWHLVGPPNTTRTLSEWPSGPRTTTLPFKLCVQTVSRTTTII
jgi:hypothetical protein